MRKIIAVFLCLVMLLGCAAVSAEQATNDKISIGKITINGAFDLQCAMPEGYSVHPLIMERDHVVSLISSEDPNKPVMQLSVAFDETYADVQRMNELDADALALLEQTFLDNDPTVDLSYGETGLGTHLLIARQSGEDVLNYIDFLSVYDGYFIEFVLTPPSLDSDMKLTEEQEAMCIEFLTQMDFIPIAEGEFTENIAGKTYPAVIDGYDAVTGTLQVTLRTPVALDRTTVETLEEGGTIEIGSDTEEIVSISRDDDGSVLINDEIELRPQENGSYQAYLYDHQYRTDLTTMQIPVSDQLVFADGIDPETLDPLDEDLVLTGAEFLAQLEAEANGGVGFAADNVNVTFDENGDLAVINRFYVPWQ